MTGDRDCVRLGSMVLRCLLLYLMTQSQIGSLVVPRNYLLVVCRLSWHRTPVDHVLLKWVERSTRRRLMVPFILFGIALSR